MTSHRLSPNEKDKSKKVKYLRFIEKANQGVYVGRFEEAEFKKQTFLCSDHSFTVFWPDFCPGSENLTDRSRLNFWKYTPLVSWLVGLVHSPSFFCHYEWKVLVGGKWGHTSQRSNDISMIWPWKWLSGSANQPVYIYVHHWSEQSTFTCISSPFDGKITCEYRLGISCYQSALSCDMYPYIIHKF